MGHNGTFQLSSPKSVPVDLDHVVHAAKHPEVSVWIALRGIAREEESILLAPVGVKVSLAIAPNTAVTFPATNA